MLTKKKILGFCILPTIAAWLGAHDLWLVPPLEIAAPGNVERIAIAVGMDFPESLHAADPAALKAQAFGPGAQIEVTLEAVEAELTTYASFTPVEHGVHAIYLSTTPNVLKLEAKKFNDYLLHDGLAHILAERLDRDELDRDASEQYRKCAKVLFDVGEGGAEDLATKAFGLELEIICERNPLRAKVGETLPVRVLLDGEPLAGANLCWDHPGNGERFSGQTWTDAEGHALVPLAQNGPMALRLIHMTRPEEEEYEWSSIWSSLCFRVP